MKSMIRKCKWYRKRITILGVLRNLFQETMKLMFRLQNACFDRMIEIYEHEETYLWMQEMKNGYKYIV